MSFEFQWDPFLPPLPSLRDHLLYCGNLQHFHIHLLLLDPWNSLLNALLLLHLASTLFLSLSKDVHDCAFGFSFFFSFFLEQLILPSRRRPSATDASRTYSGNSLGMVQYLTFDLWSWQYDLSIPLPSIFDNSSRLGWSNLLLSPHQHLCLQSVSVNFVNLAVMRHAIPHRNGEDTCNRWSNYLVSCVESRTFLGYDHCMRVR